MSVASLDGGADRAPPTVRPGSRSFAVKAGIGALLVAIFALLPLVNGDQFTISVGTTLMITRFAAVRLRLISLY